MAQLVYKIIQWSNYHLEYGPKIYNFILELYWIFFKNFLGLKAMIWIVDNGKL